MRHVILSCTPPTVNTMFINVKGKGRVKSKRYREWESMSSFELGSKMMLPANKQFEEYGLIIKLKKRSNADYSNYVKPIEDLLCALQITPDDKFNILPIIMPNDKDQVDIYILDKEEAEDLVGILTKFCS